MNAITNAFTAGSGHSAAVIAALIALLVAAVLFSLVGHALLGLWENHQAGRLEGRDAASHAMRLTVLAMFLLILLVAS